MEITTRNTVNMDSSKVSVSGLTANDFKVSEWEDLVVRCQPRVCWHYDQIFRNEAKMARDTSDFARADLYTFLEAVASLQLVAPDENQPFGPLRNLPTERSAIPEDFTESALDLLAAVVDDIKDKDSDLFARIADLLVVRRNIYRLVLDVICAYLATATLLQVHPGWREEAWVRLRRAEALAWKFNSKRGKEAVIKHIKDAIQACLPTPHDVDWGASLMRLLLKRKEGDHTFYAPLSDDFGQKYLAQSAWDEARLYWTVEAEWHTRGGDTEAARNALLKAARSYGIQSEDAAKDGTSFADIRAAHWLKLAVLSTQGVPNPPTTEIERLHRRMLEHQRLGAEAMGDFTLTELPMNEQVIQMGEALTQIAEGNARGKSSRDALYALVEFPGPTNAKQMRELAEGQASFIFRGFFGAQRFDTRGRTIAERGPAPDDPDEEHLRSVMCELAEQFQANFVTWVIDPVRRLIANEHRIGGDELLALVRECPLATAGQAPLWALGLHAGLYGDFAFAAHLLAPRLEDGGRRILAKNGAVDGEASGVLGKENAQSLPVLLHTKETYAALEEAIGEDAAFDLFSLLIGRFGSNLRNMVEHGLLHEAAIRYGASSVYLWWVALKLCLMTRAVVVDEEGRKIAPATSESVAAETGREIQVTGSDRSDDTLPSTTDDSSHKTGE